MSLYLNPKTSIVTALNKQLLINNPLAVPIAETDYSFQSISDTSTSEWNTKIKLTPINPLVSYLGEFEFLTNRLNLQDFKLLANLSVGTSVPATLLDIVASLNLNYGTNFTVEDFEETEDFDTYGKLQLVASPSSLGWVGTLEVLLTETNVEIGDLIDTSELPGFNYPTDDINKIIGITYSYPLNCTDLYPVLSHESLDLDLLATGLATITGDAWTVSETGADFNLFGSIVTYNGATVSTEYNTDYDFVAVIELGLSNAISGTLVLHYNLLVDPEQI